LRKMRKDEAAMKIRKNRFYTNDSSSLVIYVQQVSFYDWILVHGELYAKPNGRLVDYDSYRIHNSDDWREYKTLEEALKTSLSCQTEATIELEDPRTFRHCLDLPCPL